MQFDLAPSRKAAARTSLEEIRSENLTYPGLDEALAALAAS
ncbi:hypothetical protein [Rhodococcus triatomae]